MSIIARVRKRSRIPLVATSGVPRAHRPDLVHHEKASVQTRISHIPQLRAKNKIWKTLTRHSQPLPHPTSTINACPPTQIKASYSPRITPFGSARFTYVYRLSPAGIVTFVTLGAPSAASTMVYGDFPPLIMSPHGSHVASSCVAFAAKAKSGVVGDSFGRHAVDAPAVARVYGQGGHECGRANWRENVRATV